MYIPASFKITSNKELVEFIQWNSFGIMFSQVDGHPFATHLPMLYRQVNTEKAVLLGHFAKANPQWKELDGKEVLVVFQGPHAYISPSWYVESKAVPTWNYVAVHVTGRCRLMQEREELHTLLRETVRFYESNSKLLDHMDEEFYVKMENGVVGFEIEITEMNGKAKLSQNKSIDTMQGVIDGLSQSSDIFAGEIAKLMQLSLDKRTGNE